MWNGKKLPDLYLMSKFPNLESELKNVLPKEVNITIVPFSDQRIKWDKGINLTDEEINFVKEAEVLVVDSMFLSKMLYKLPKVKWVQGTWAGVEMIFEELDKSKPIPNFQLTRYVDSYFGELMANYAIAQIINLERGFYVHHDDQKASQWIRPFFPDYRVLSELTIGILGSGKLGSSVGRLLKASGCHVLAFVRSKRKEHSDCFDKATTNLNEIFESSDYICNVLPSTEDTRGLLDRDVLQNCKKKPVFINIGRGDVIEEDSIIKALKEGWISKAVLDVFEEEPLPAESPLWTMPEVYITPHIGAFPKISRIAEFIAENYMRYVDGQPLNNVVDWNVGY